MPTRACIKHVCKPEAASKLNLDEFHAMMEAVSSSGDESVQRAAESDSDDSQATLPKKRKIKEVEVAKRQSPNEEAKQQKAPDKEANEKKEKRAKHSGASESDEDGKDKDKEKGSKRKKSNSDSDEESSPRKEATPGKKYRNQELYVATRLSKFTASEAKLLYKDTF